MTGSVSDRAWEADPGGRGMGGRAEDLNCDPWTWPTIKRVVRVEKVHPINYPVSARAGGAGLDKCLWQGLGSRFGWMGRGWPGMAPGPWSGNTADEETGSLRRKGEPSQLSSVKKGGTGGQWTGPHLTLVSVSLWRGFRLFMTGVCLWWGTSQCPKVTGTTSF